MIPDFDYFAIDSNNKRIAGKIRAVDRDQAANQLHSKGYFVSQIHEATPPEQKANEGLPAQQTVRVRIAVAVDEYGDWSAYGSNYHDDEWASQEAVDNIREVPIRSVYFVEADLPIPVAETVQGKVTGA